ASSEQPNRDLCLTCIRSTILLLGVLIRQSCKSPLQRTHLLNVLAQMVEIAFGQNSHHAATQTVQRSWCDTILQMWQQIVNLNNQSVLLMLRDNACFTMLIELQSTVDTSNIPAELFINVALRLDKLLWSSTAQRIPMRISKAARTLLCKVASRLSECSLEASAEVGEFVNYLMLVCIDASTLVPHLQLLLHALCKLVCRQLVSLSSQFCDLVRSLILGRLHDSDIREVAITSACDYLRHCSNENLSSVPILAQSVLSNMMNSPEDDELASCLQFCILYIQRCGDNDEFVRVLESSFISKCLTDPSGQVRVNILNLTQTALQKLGPRSSLTLALTNATIGTSKALWQLAHDPDHAVRVTLCELCNGYIAEFCSHGEQPAYASGEIAQECVRVIIALAQSSSRIDRQAAHSALVDIMRLVGGTSETSAQAEQPSQRRRVVFDNDADCGRQTIIVAIREQLSTIDLDQLHLTTQPEPMFAELFEPNGQDPSTWTAIIDESDSRNTGKNIIDC
ncbi:hypothetical protein GQ42DRAFT_160323, partial [Ramicandelaber brevisporus]